VRLLFVKHALAWPRSSGHDVHTFYMMKACAALGHEVALATVVEPTAQAVSGLVLSACFTLAGTAGGTVPKGTRLQERFRSFWGVTDGQVTNLVQAARAFRPDAVIIGGLDALPYFPALKGTTRVWYAADEWVIHHLSMVRARGGEALDNLRAAAIKGLYERAHRTVVDRAWVVTERDRRAMRWIAGMPAVDVLPNGVDAEFFQPGPELPAEHTAVFWGRLDFGPNIQALHWFCKRVWPDIRRQVPDARFTIIGFQPGNAVRTLASADGIQLEADLADLRAVARRHAVCVLPFVSGAGIKNKLLEAAALGLPIVGTPLSALGLRGKPPIVTATSPAAFRDALVALWQDERRQRELSASGREWVMAHHSWISTARQALATLDIGARAAA